LQGGFGDGDRNETGEERGKVISAVVKAFTQAAG